MALRRSTTFRLLLGTYAVACLGVAVGLWQQLRVPRGILVETGAATPPEEVWPQDSQYAVDPVVGHRPRGNHRVTFSMGALHGEPTRQVRIQDNLGFVRVQDVQGEVGQPCVLVVGDSHVMGVVSNPQNATFLLEKALRLFPGWKDATVINASAGYYSLYQYVLRARTVVPLVRPRWIVFAVFMGNDFLELEDESRPHLDDAGHECPPSPHPPPETTSERRELLGLGDSGLFFQGLNQACYFHQHPGRLEGVEERTRAALERARSLAAGCGARLVVVEIPSYATVFPAQARALGPAVGPVLDAWATLDWPARFEALVDGLGIDRIDLLPAFRADGKESLYATDYHIFVRGHELLAQKLGEWLLAHGPGEPPEER